MRRVGVIITRLWTKHGGTIEAYLNAKIVQRNFRRTQMQNVTSASPHMRRFSGMHMHCIRSRFHARRTPCWELDRFALMRMDEFIALLPPAARKGERGEGGEGEGGEGAEEFVDYVKAKAKNKDQTKGRRPDSHTTQRHRNACRHKTKRRDEKTGSVRSGRAVRC
jgi:hypothetical protein